MPPPKCNFFRFILEPQTQIPMILRLFRSAPVAQLDRAPDYGSGGWGFDSLRVCHSVPDAVGVDAFAEGGSGDAEDFCGFELVAAGFF